MPDGRNNPRLRTGLFGGSFNPVHNGHLALARRLLDTALLDEVWFMVSPQNPLKRHSDLLDDATRLRMVHLALEDDPRMQASDLEFHLPRPSYTWRTLQEAGRRWPERDFRLIIGADNWLLFDRWRAYNEILARYGIIIYPRPGSPVDTYRLPDNVTLVPMPMNGVSSTEVRRRISKGLSVDGLVPQKVAGFIHRNGLYR